MICVSTSSFQNSSNLRRWNVSNLTLELFMNVNIRLQQMNLKFIYMSLIFLLMCLFCSLAFWKNCDSFSTLMKHFTENFNITKIVFNDVSSFSVMRKLWDFHCHLSLINDWLSELSFSDSSNSLETNQVLLNLINRLMHENVDNCSTAEVDLLCMIKFNNNLKFNSFESIYLTTSSFRAVKINISWSESASVCSINFTSLLSVSVLSFDVCKSDSVRTVVTLINFFTDINDWRHERDFMNKLSVKS